MNWQVILGEAAQFSFMSSCVVLCDDSHVGREAVCLTFSLQQPVVSCLDFPNLSEK